MTDLKFSILEKLYNTDNRTMHQTDLLNSFRGQINNAKRDVDNFVEHKYISRTKEDKLELTSDGEYLYENTLEAMQEKEYLRKQNDTSRNIAIISVIAAGIAAAVPLIEFILALFGIALR